MFHNMAGTFAATSSGGFPIPPWLGDSAISAWISPATDTLVLGSGTPYRYETSFSLSGFNPATARVAGRWATDNIGTDIMINQFSTGQGNTAQFGAWTYFVINTGFLPGVNKLSFILNNGTSGEPPGGDPSGLRVEMWGMAALDCTVGRIAPSINITRQAGRIVISWSGSGFMLQSATAVTGPWGDYTRGSSINGQNFSATVSATGAARFFRLRFECP